MEGVIKDLFQLQKQVLKKYICRVLYGAKIGVLSLNSSSKSSLLKIIVNCRYQL